MFLQHTLNSLALNIWVLSFKKLHCDGGNTSIKKASATSRPTVTVQFAVGIFDGELVVVGELLSAINLPQCEDYDVLLAIHVDHSRVAVRIT